MSKDKTKYQERVTAEDKRKNEEELLKEFGIDPNNIPIAPSLLNNSRRPSRAEEENEDFSSLLGCLAPIIIGIIFIIFAIVAK